MRYDKTYWHDGNIKTINYRFPLSRREKASIEMVLELYKDHNAETPSDYRVIFPSVTEILKSIDFHAIVDNVGAGSVEWVDQKELTINGKKSYMYTVNLFGGRFVIYSGKIRINKIL